MNKKLLSFVITIFCMLLISCAKDMPPGNYDAAEIGKIKKVVPGVIISRRPVNIQSKTSDSLAAAPNAAVGETEVDSTAVNRSHGFEYVIRLNNGSIISVVQTEDLRLKSRQRILVIYGNNTRVVPDEGSDEY